jgi:dGTPase
VPSTSSSENPRLTRRFTETKRGDFREPAQRDYDRIVYSSAFRRLAGVTQVVSPDQTQVFHNRLTHSMKVGQVARRLAQKVQKQSPAKTKAVGGVDPDVAEAAGIAHDLGHPPFGHIGEEELRDRLVGKEVWDGFEGNAQSFRIVTQLALRTPTHPGLNLTRATLNALLKYPWTRQSDGKKAAKYGAYQTEIDDLKFARVLSKGASDDRKSPEAELMDWADDITYAVHDLEDFYRAGLIPLHRLQSLRDDSERVRFFDGMYARPELKRKLGDDSRSQLEQDFFDAVALFPIAEAYTATREQRSRLRDFSSTLIDQFIGAIELNQPPSREIRFVKIRTKEERQVRVLKALTWYYVIYNPSLATQQFGQREIIRRVFNIFYDAGTASDDEECNIFPLAFRQDVLSANREPKHVTRIVSDFVAGMSDQEVVRIYHRLTGTSLGSLQRYF